VEGKVLEILFILTMSLMLYQLLMEKGIVGETYHIASNKMTSIKEIVNLISKKLGY
jgi:dTDP-D-glucose 4,6-dehydratase